MGIRSVVFFLEGFLRGGTLCFLINLSACLISFSGLFLFIFSFLLVSISSYDSMLCCLEKSRLGVMSED